MVGLLLVVVLVAGSSTVALAADPPTMSISPGVASPGQTITVSVAAWPAGSAEAALCGPRPTAADRPCDAGGGRSIAIAGDGTGTTTLVVDPSVGCPCVIQITAPNGGLVQALPLEVIGAGPAPSTASVAADSGPSSSPTEAHQPATQNTTIWAVAAAATLALLLGLGVVVSRRRARGSARRPGDQSAGDQKVAGT